MNAVSCSYQNYNVLSNGSTLYIFLVFQNLTEKDQKLEKHWQVTQNSFYPHSNCLFMYFTILYHFKSVFLFLI